MKLELKGVTCGYWGRAVVSGVSMEVESGEIMCLLGPNGSGKTTLFKTILGLIKPQAGDILLGGKNICGWPQARIARVMGYIPQAHNPPFPFKVLDVVLMGRTAHLGTMAAPGREDVAIARRAIATLNISHLEDRIYTEISGGERQLVLIARALAQEPRLLIMDEPTSALDFGNQLLVLSHIKRLAQMGLAIIMASHFPDHALLYASKVMLLKKGQVYSLGRPEETVTEESLKNLYGVDVKIISTSLPGEQKAQVCIPVSR
ncbi:iron ABC transporter ATP-binding protein [Moorella thermoacetica]|uniref:ABC transporter related protein n=1 Tax=Moorella thermoacetica (strain ATCC 39073 / JCM 9320) TaxID=264732 RepID=Q2RIK3_MOOTA|nr:ABC transporter ATP-binding protein [Moorella thermoacetica]AKX94206.1 putative ABC transporter ATP-binding protein [Moorella thermoacetica]AKX96845.1 putative ABC transporter ATP-binding protein [Moorella thermoacetica]OIQ58015.1 putative ABC transporter ATP-binding protein [Moorella thermoacetica]QDA00674.1 putative ABC transporter ATP-binding protein [Moorella thermoacetica]TYL11569.1 putative ABC transporter ATP-binding protein [Moorella thermoacetica]